MPYITRRQMLSSICSAAGFSLAVGKTQAFPIHCTPAPTFPVPLTAGVWRSAEFPVGKHDYHVSLAVDRLPLEQLDCDLGPPRTGQHCDNPPLLNVEWNVWDRQVLVKSWHAKPVRADFWAADETGCILGGFEGRRNGMFTLEWNVKVDAGRLKELHPRIEVVKHPGYWCWL
jgi:hypothetical protein